jgi:ATP-binding cassette subfamily F protein 3
MPSNVYLLDEPTNHLDVVAREAIESFLQEAPATMLVVSHDRRFLETVVERLWVVDDGQVAPFDGGYRAWRAAISDGWTVAGALEQEARRLQPGASRARVGSDPFGVVARRGDVLNGSEAGARTAAGTEARGGAPAGRGAAGASAVSAAPTRPKLPKLSKDAYRRQRESVDADLTRLGLRKIHLELELGRPAVQSNFIELRRVTSELADVDTALAAAEDAWLALEERAP